MQDFYDYSVDVTAEAARRLEPAIRQAELVHRVVSDIGPDIENIRTVHVRVLQPDMETQRAADAAESLAARLGLLVQSMNLGVVAPIQPVLEKLRPAQMDLVKSACVNIVAPIQLALDQWCTALATDALRVLNSMDWASLAAAARAAAATQTGTAAGVFVVPSPTTGTTEKAATRRGKSTAPDRIIGLTCGRMLAVMLVWMALLGMPLFQQALPPQVQAMLNSEVGTIALAIVLTSIIAHDRRG